ncbi:MAG TPA: XisI protein [Gemmataceae bacterium]|nr:XisI protein [Gemmataceae bacterium]
MVTLESLRKAVETLLQSHVGPPSAKGNVQTQTVFDRAGDHYLLVNVGWVERRRIYGTMAHIDLIGDKIWVQTDGTEEGLAFQLAEAGIPRDQIVLGYRMAEIRPHTGYAVV